MEKNCDRDSVISLHDPSYCEVFGADPGPVDGVLVGGGGIGVAGSFGN